MLSQLHVELSYCSNSSHYQQCLLIVIMLILLRTLYHKMVALTLTPKLFHTNYRLGTKDREGSVIGLLLTC